MDRILASSTTASLRTQLKDLRSAGHAEFYERVDLRAWTAIRVGGTADLVIRCRSIDGARWVLDLLAAHGLPWLVIGTGSKLLIPDRGLRVPVITLGGRLVGWTMTDDGVVSGAGASLSQIARATTASQIGGFERLIGTSGSLGGTLATSVGEGPATVVSSSVEWTEWLRPGCGPMRFEGSGSDPRCPSSRSLLVRVKIGLSSSRGSRSPSEIPKAPLPTAGSINPTFARPPKEERTASELLAAAGCTDLSLGGVRIQEDDVNCLRISRAGTASDVLTLCRRIRARVEEKTGIRLQLLLQPVDEEGREVVP